jgi:copper transport protein
VALGIGLLAALGAPATVAAANSIVSSTPADGATVDVSPPELRLVFAEPLDEQNTVTVSCDTVAVTVPLAEVDDADDTNLVVPLVDTPLPKGTCTVRWAVTDRDDQVIAGQFVFTVQQDTVTTTSLDPTQTSIAPSATPTTAVPAIGGSGSGDSSADAEAGSTGGPLWLGRVLSTLGTMVVFGALVLVVMAWPEGPEYVLTVRFLRSAWLLALSGTVLFVVSFTADVSGRSFGSAFSPGAWTDLLDAGWPGRAALARLALVLACGWVVARPERVIDPTTQMVAIGLPLLAVAAIGLSRTDGDFAAVGVAVAILHVLATAVWFGGVALVARVVLAGPGDEDLVHAVRGFSRISAPALLVASLTGIVQVIRLDGGVLFSTSHGRVVLLKAIVVAGMLLLVSVAARQFVRARLDRAAEMPLAIAGRLRRAFTAEAGFGVLTLMLSGWLLALQPGNIEVSDGVDYDIRLPFRANDRDLDVTVWLTSDEVGLNGLKVRVDSPSSDLSGLTITFTPPVGSTAFGLSQPIPLTGEGIAVLAEATGLPFTAAGTWQATLSGTTVLGQVSSTTTFEIVVPEDATTTTAVAGVTAPPVATVTVPVSAAG